MDAKQKRLVRNIVSGTVLLILLLFTLAYCGVFEGAQSDEAQIRELMERSREEISDHDWDDFFDLCDLPQAEREGWLEAKPDLAEYVQIDSITPKSFISVPAGATEFELEVSVVAHLEKIGISGPQLDAVEGTMFFVKKNDRWYIDLDRSSSTFPYVTKPKK
jgi:hypothetical protein